MGVRLQKISYLSRLFLFTGPFLHYRRFWAEDSLVKFGVHSCKSFVRQCSQRCCAESGQTVFAPSGWFSFSASKTSPERLRKPGEFSLSRRFIAADSFPWKTNIQDASDVSSILNSASYRMAALDEVTEASAATERTMKNLPQIGTKMGVKDQYCKNSRYILESGLSRSCILSCVNFIAFIRLGNLVLLASRGLVCDLSRCFVLCSWKTSRRFSQNLGRITGNSIKVIEFRTELVLNY